MARRSWPADQLRRKGSCWRCLMWSCAIFVGTMLAFPAACAADEGDVWSRTVDFFTLRYDFLAYTIAGSVLVGLTCGLLGVYLVLRRLSLMGDTLGHAALPGVGVAFIVVQSKDLGAIVVGALTTAVAASLTVGWITRNSKTRDDAALGIVLATFFGVGAVIFSYLQRDPSAAQSGLNDFLFGNAAAITSAEVVLLVVLFVVSLVFVVVFHRPLMLATFDETFASVAGVPTRPLHYALMALVAFAIVAGMQSAGAVLVAAMVIIPASTAHLLTDRMHWTLAVAAVVGGLSGLLGTLLSFLFEGWSSGPSMVVVAAGLYTLALVAGPKRGLVAVWARRRQRQGRTS